MKKGELKGRPKTTWIDINHGIMTEMEFMKVDWRRRENWRQEITGQIQMGICENIV